MKLHCVDFPLASRPIVPPPSPPNRVEISEFYHSQALQGISSFRWSARAAAKRTADTQTEYEIQRLLDAASQWQSQQQRWLNQRWLDLNANEPTVVIETLEEAFEDNESPSAAVGVQGNEVSLVVLVPPAELVVPERMPSTTEAGNLSLKKTSKGDQSAYYRSFVCGQLLVTARETFAVVPSIDATRIVVLRNDGHDAYGRPAVSCLLAARFIRKAFSGVQWNATPAPMIVNDTATELIVNMKGQNKELSAVSLTGQPGLTALIAAVDLQELTNTR